MKEDWISDLLAAAALPKPVYPLFISLRHMAVGWAGPHWVPVGAYRPR